MELPGMELLGFYDEPNSVYVDPPRPRRVFNSVQDSHTVRQRPVLSTAMSLVQDLWENTEISADAFERWVPGVVARRKLSTGNLRTATVVWALVAAVVLAVVAWMTIARPGIVAERADAALRSDATTLTATLEPLSQLALSLGGPDQPDLVVATSTVLDAEAAARDLFTSAGELGDSEKELARREQAVTAAGGLLDKSAEISRLVAYGLSVEQALFVPSLPTAPAADQISATAGEIAQWRSQVDAILADLPATVLPAQTAQLVAWGAGLGTWQEYYLNAMREDDAGTMLAAVTAKVDQVAALRGELKEALNDRGTEIASVLDEVTVSATALVGG